MKNDSDLLAGREVIIEISSAGGNVARISAMDVKTLVEISIQGPMNAPEETLRRNALKRLEYVLKKRGILV